MSTSRQVILVRHGEAAASWGQSPDPGLSELGQQQAERVCEQLRPRFAALSPNIISSPLLRAQETAAPLATSLAAAIELDARFREIPSPSPLESRQTWLRSFMGGRWSDQDAGLHQWRSEMIHALEGLADSSVVFTHFLVINTIVGWIRDVDETLVFWPANASVTTVTFADGIWTAETGEEMESRVN